ncbi:MAG: T9SS type A sorting domain-containing protein [Ignavibacteria bacterium]|nr:T9SS type A sorting domain-containing protein [Ignavibacteria bacterium]
MEKNKFINKISSLLFYISILTFIIAFNFAHNPPGGWYQQSLPNINGASIRDMTFTDSLNGYIVTSIGGSNSYILKTTNGGDNWDLKFTHNQPFVKVQFINANTGFTNAFTKIFKTTNAGENWNAINLPQIFGDDMSVLNEDTVWLAMSEGFTGGVFRTTNGGLNWVQQLNLGSQNPSHIYFYNSRIGFSATGAGLYKTTNSGVNWFLGGGGFFIDIHFTDSLTGWKNNGTGTIFQKTTDGGLNWVTYNLPPETGTIVLSRLIRFNNVSRDTIWGAGPVSITGRALIYKSTNSGISFGYEVIDTSINIFQFRHIEFSSRLNGWVYGGSSGVHTTSGGDTTFYTNIAISGYNIPDYYKLHQNYPNPFNPLTNIEYELKLPANIKLKVYNILGMEVITLVNKRQITGTYKIRFSSLDLTGGVYFYSLFVNEKLIDTKKMILVR